MRARSWLRSNKLWLLGLLLIFFRLTATTPKEPPYYRFIVAGTITRPDGLPLEDFTIQLAGWARGEDTLFHRIGVAPADQDASLQPVGITNMAGEFRIVASSQQPFDSLRLEVVAPDNGTLHGAPFPTSRPTEAVTRYVEDPFADDGCSCIAESDPTLDTVGYVVNLPSQILNVTR